MSKKADEITTPEIEEITAAPMSDSGTGEVEETTPPDAPVNDFLNNPDVLAYINKQVQEGIKKALQGKAPKANTTNPTEQEIKNFDRMTYKERLNLFKSNPQTYYKLSKGVK